MEINKSIANRPDVLLVNRCLIVNDDEEFLLIRRALADRFNPGLWEFPGGKVDRGETLTNSCKREIEDETGLLVEPSSDLVFADDHIIDKGIFKDWLYVAHFSLARVVGGSLALSNEHQDYSWEAYDTALEYELTPGSRRALMTLGKIGLNFS